MEKYKTIYSDVRRPRQIFSEGTKFPFLRTNNIYFEDFDEEMSSRGEVWGVKRKTVLYVSGLLAFIELFWSLHSDYKRQDNFQISIISHVVTEGVAGMCHSQSYPVYTNHKKNVPQ